MDTFFSTLPDPAFPTDYAQARLDFLASLPRSSLPAAHRALPCVGNGPANESLFTDLAWLGPSGAANVMVVISATHGVEGFAGSAAQCMLLSELKHLPADTAVLIIHALNPWGFAWQRRCDREGIDLNRNFIDFSRPLPDNPGYRALRKTLYDTPPEELSQVLEHWQAEHGRQALEVALSGGQYQDPLGPFYGGRAPAEAHRHMDWLITHFRLAERRLAVIDIHTGLGNWGEGEVICDHPPDSAGTHLAQQWYGGRVTLPAAGTSSSVPKLGLLDYAWHAIMADRGCYVTLEFGTYSTEQLFRVLLDDHRRHAAGLPGDMAAMRAHFCPDNRDWQQRVLAQCRQAFQQGLAGLIQ
jgi:predicted deacylase